ncbi:MAG TPA: hypothetical protein VFV58_05590 [Blastocatellia bacterium]|jgi:hypothetical protein|nr:hypothetical protein [Blastocatellia bacterium]
MEEKLSRAFQLAYYILREELAAVNAAREAVSALEVTLVRQDKRVHYSPSHRTKVSLGEWQMLQRLVYFASEPEERRQEERGVPEDALVTHYIKHLVYITGRRNSFFVALGLSRLLHNYTTAETAQIHELVTQDPDRGRDDSYYRRRKAQLMRELQERFGALLAVQRGARGEERFQALPDAEAHLARVRGCLREFTPWETYCNLPAVFDPHTDELPSLCFRGDDPDGEHEVEIRRLHALLHPDCFERLLAALRLEEPAKRLEVPKFQLRESQPSEPPSGGQPPSSSLSEEDMQSLKESIIQERERRRRFSPAWLRIVVDRVERARWPMQQSRSGSIEITPDDRMVEIYGFRDGEDTRLAAHFLSYDLEDRLRPVAAKITLEGGQELRLAVEPLPTADNEDAGATFAVRYRETAPMRALLLWGRSLRLFNPAQLLSWKPAMALLFLVLSGGVLGYLTVIKLKAPGDKLAGETTPRTEIVLPTPPTKATSPRPGPTATPLPRPVAPAPFSGDEVIAMDIRHPAGESLTRGAPTPGAGLLEANKIYLEISGSRSEQARRLLIQRLPAENKFSLTDNPDETDVALIVTVAARRQGRFAFTAHIADQNGNVIWPLTPGVAGRKYEGPLEKVIATFSRDLAADLRRSARRK